MERHITISKSADTIEFYCNGFKASLDKCNDYWCLEAGFDVSHGAFAKHFASTTDLIELFYLIEFVKDWLRWGTRLYFEPWRLDNFEARRIDAFTMLFPGMKRIVTEAHGAGFTWKKLGTKSLESRFRKRYGKIKWVVNEFQLNPDDDLEEAQTKMEGFLANR